jgi:hypothetical protein
MTREDIIRMAREAELNAHGLVIDRIERFAALVAAHTLSNIDPSKLMSFQEGFEAGRVAEREQCAKVAAAWQTDVLNPLYHCDCATAIRRRGEK